MKGFVLAAGFGQRLRPLTETLPKPLLPVGRVPLIGYALRLLAYHGITEVIVNAHHLEKTLRERLGDGSAFGVHVTYSVEEELLGTGGALRAVHEQLADDTFVVVNGDTIVDVDLADVIRQHRSRGALATMVLRQDPGQEQFGQIEIDASERIRRILGHAGPDVETSELQSYMFTGVHVLEPGFLDYIPPDVNTCINRYAYTKALSNGESLYGFLGTGYWADAGTPWRYFQTNVDALEQRMNLRHIDPLGGYAHAPKKDVAEVVRMGADVELGADVRIVPPVVLGDGVRIADHATVGPFVVAGERVSIGKEAVVRRGVLLDGSRVESGATVEHTLVGRKAMLPFTSATDETVPD